MPYNIDELSKHETSVALARVTSRPLAAIGTRPCVRFDRAGDAYSLHHISRGAMRHSKGSLAATRAVLRTRCDVTAAEQEEET
jgi:hypothetical protein